MTSRDRVLLARGLLVLVVGWLMIFGAACLGVMQGTVVFIILQEGGWTYTAAGMAGVLAGAVGFAAGWAGEQHAMSWLRAFLDPGPEDEGSDGV